MVELNAYVWDRKNGAGFQHTFSVLELKIQPFIFSETEQEHLLSYMMEQFVKLRLNKIYMCVCVCFGDVTSDDRMNY